MIKALSILRTASCLKWTIMLAGVLVLGGCSEESEDPFANLINGRITASISGSRSDGSAIQESVSYLYSLTPDVFRDDVVNGGYTLVANRSRSPIPSSTGTIVLGLHIDDVEAPDQVELSAGSITYTKELSGEELFVIQASPNFTEFQLLYPLSEQENTPFQFEFIFTDEGETIVDYTEEGWIGFTTTDGYRAYYTHPYLGTGELESVTDLAGNAISDPAILDRFSPIVLSTSDSGALLFRNSAGDDLSALVTIPPDTSGISNYQYDKNTGRLKFDFTLTIGDGPGRTNSTGHALTINGHAEFNAYKIVH